MTTQSIFDILILDLLALSLKAEHGVIPTIVGDWVLMNEPVGLLAVESDTCTPMIDIVRHGKSVYPVEGCRV